MVARFQKIKAFLSNEHHLASLFFMFGFIWDSLTLTRVDLFYDNLVLSIYLGIAFLGILTYHLLEAKRFQTRFDEHSKRLILFLIQFAFGGLFSGYVIYYSKSATLSASWPFLLFLVSLFVGNEIFRKRYLKSTFQLSIFFIVVFSYTTFSIPTLLGRIGGEVFLLSGIISLILTFFLFGLLSTIARTYMKEVRRRLLLSVSIIYIFFNLAYFTNSIPPIPLAPKEITVAHSVVKLPSGEYRITFEPARKFFFFKETSATFHWKRGESVYVYSSVFAPTSLRTKILHRWSYYNESLNKWIVSSTVEFPISGGRDEGYRGYSIKESLTPGEWRVDVITEDGKLIERSSFRVIETNQAPKTEIKIR